MFKTIAKVAIAVMLSASAFSSVAQELSCERIRAELQFWSRQYALQKCLGAPVTDVRCENVRQSILKYSRMYREKNCSVANSSLVDQDGFKID